MAAMRLQLKVTERGLGLQAETKLDPSYSLIVIVYGVSVLCISILTMYFIFGWYAAAL
jgi:hypothetical protein